MNEVVLKDARNQVLRVPAKTIEQLVPQRQSLMPDLLFRDMTAQQVADLLAYLSSLWASGSSNRLHDVGAVSKPRFSFSPARGPG